MTLAFAGFAIWILETIYFGYNATPQSGAESVLDFVSAVMIVWGILGDLASTLYVVKIDSPHPVDIATNVVVNGKIIREDFKNQTHELL